MSVTLAASIFLLCAGQAASREGGELCFQLQYFVPQWHLAAAVTDKISHGLCSPGLEQVSADGLFREFICQNAEHMQSMIKVLGWL